MFMLVTGAVLDPKTRALSRQERGSIWTMWALLVLALSYVHRRIAGTHQLLDMVNLSPATGGGIVGVVLIFLGFSVVFATVSERDQFGNSIAGCFGVWTVCWGLSLFEWFGFNAPCWLSWPVCTYWLGSTVLMSQPAVDCTSTSLSGST